MLEAGGLVGCCWSSVCAYMMGAVVSTAPRTHDINFTKSSMDAALLRCWRSLLAVVFSNFEVDPRRVGWLENAAACESRNLPRLLPSHGATCTMVQRIYGERGTKSYAGRCRCGAASLSDAGRQWDLLRSRRRVAPASDRSGAHGGCCPECHRGGAHPQGVLFRTTHCQSGRRDTHRHPLRSFP